MPRYLLTVAYDGTRFNGWQRQPHPEQRTVEEELERALSQRFQQEIDVIGQGRTDAGVHAEGQTAHVDLPEKIEPRELTYALLGLLPRDIAVLNIQQTAVDFHARYDATYRLYRYQILTEPRPLYRSAAHMELRPLDLELMQACAEMVQGEHDFESFTISSSLDGRHARCHLMETSLTYDSPWLLYRICGNRFLRRMVRRLVGSMLQVGLGTITLADFQDLLKTPREDIGGHAAPAKGLILEEVNYGNRGGNNS
ncbi:MAG: tRNA pseudouridine(38-40) synthase TruA [Bacteroidota bacterium]